MWYKTRSKHPMSDDDFDKMIEDNQEYAKRRQVLDKQFNQNEISEKAYMTACDKIKYLQAHVVLYNNKDATAFNNSVKSYMTRHHLQSLPLQYAYCGHMAGDFSNVDLANATLENISNAHFTDCNMQNTKLVGDIYRSKFVSCDINSMRFMPQLAADGIPIKQNVLDTEFTACNAKRLSADYDTVFKSCNFTSCNLDEASFECKQDDYAQPKLHGVKFKSCGMTNTDFSGSSLTDVTLVKCYSDFLSLNAVSSKSVEYQGVQVVNSDMANISANFVGGDLFLKNVKGHGSLDVTAVDLSSLKNDTSKIDLRVRDSDVVFIDNDADYGRSDIEAARLSSAVFENCNILHFHDKPLPFTLDEDDRGYKCKPIFSNCEFVSGLGQKMDYEPYFVGEPVPEHSKQTDTQFTGQDVDKNDETYSSSSFTGHDSDKGAANDDPDVESESSKSKYKSFTSSKKKTFKYGNTSRDAILNAMNANAKLKQKSCDHSKTESSMSNADKVHWRSYTRRKIDFSKVLELQAKAQRSNTDAYKQSFTYRTPGASSAKTCSAKDVDRSDKSGTNDDVYRQRVAQTQAKVEILKGFGKDDKQPDLC